MYQQHCCSNVACIQNKLFLSHGSKENECVATCQQHQCLYDQCIDLWISVYQAATRDGVWQRRCDERCNCVWWKKNATRRRGVGGASREKESERDTTPSTQTAVSEHLCCGNVAYTMYPLYCSWSNSLQIVSELLQDCVWAVADIKCIAKQCKWIPSKTPLDEVVSVLVLNK